VSAVERDRLRIVSGVISRHLDRAQSRLPGPLRTLIDWALTVAVAVVVVLAFEAEVAKPYRIPSASMEPTLHCARPAIGCRASFSDRVLVSRVAYRIRDPRRGEIVVFRAPRAAGATCGGAGTFVKRIIGLPGDVVEMKNGYVYVNGRAIDESAYIESSFQRGNEWGLWDVSRSAYFLLGDNRTNSCDSRAFGVVARSDLIGPVVARYWPPTRVGDTR
jgi:signal peptidase I